ncbi:6-bladed beta-propeller, partial [Mediterranea massiliensis]|uniref:6-bladed beta-propeller n=3 Tax=Mediterranea TaxID=1926659 RepID=UPI0025A4A653
VYPYFSNRIYEWTNDSLKVCLEMKWGDRTFPEAAVFEKAEDSGDVMREILSDDYIHFLYVYENQAALAVKYYVQKDLYLSVYNKSSGRVANVKAADVQDDLGLGGLFPMPVGTDGDLLVGSLSLLDMKEKITSPELKACLNQVDEEGNPVLVFYDLN